MTSLPECSLSLGYFESPVVKHNLDGMFLKMSRCGGSWVSVVEEETFTKVELREDPLQISRKSLFYLKKKQAANVNEQIQILHC